MTSPIFKVVVSPGTERAADLTYMAFLVPLQLVAFFVFLLTAPLITRPRSLLGEVLRRRSIITYTTSRSVAKIITAKRRTIKRNTRKCEAERRYRESRKVPRGSLRESSRARALEGMAGNIFLILRLNHRTWTAGGGQRGCGDILARVRSIRSDEAGILNASCEFAYFIFHSFMRSITARGSKEGIVREGRRVPWRGTL